MSRERHDVSNHGQFDYLQVILFIECLAGITMSNRSETGENNSIGRPILDVRIRVDETVLVRHLEK